MHPVNMKPVEGLRKTIYAESQPEYTPLPALISSDSVVITEWELTDEERAHIAAGGRIRLHNWTFKQRLQPIAVEVIEKAKCLELEPTN